MISVDEALALVLGHARPRPPARLPIAEAPGLILAEEVFSHIDSPPYDKSLVDGYAVRREDLLGPAVDLAVLEEVTAGQTPTRKVISGTAIGIMTGAPLPDGADAVIMVEATEPLPDCGGTAMIRIAAQKAKPGQHIMPRGTSIRSGDRILTPGRTLRPIEIGLLAEVGAADVLVHPRPTVAVLATGNELVPTEQVPGPSEIRNSNGPMLRALVHCAGGLARDLGIGRDDEQELARLARQGLECDVLVLSGGVSAGVLDLVPNVLKRMGVAQVFHKLDLKPGKPLWFGAASGDRGDTLVFGLPGNPVSTLVCFELFVRPAIVRLGGGLANQRSLQPARLAKDHRHRSDRVTFYPARMTERDGEMVVEPLAWQGSADLRTLASAGCLVRFSAGGRDYAAGERVEIYTL